MGHCKCLEEFQTFAHGILLMCSGLLTFFFIIFVQEGLRGVRDKASGWAGVCVCTLREEKEGQPGLVVWPDFQSSRQRGPVAPESCLAKAHLSPLYSGLCEWLPGGSFGVACFSA